MNPEPTPEKRKPAPELETHAAPVIDRSPLPMVEVEGPDHLLCFVNPAFCRLLNKERAELVGKSFAEIVRNGAKCVPLLDRVYRTGEFETHVEPDGTESTPAYWLYAMWPALDEKKCPARVVIQMTKSAYSHQNVAAMNEALLLSGLREHELREAAEKANARLKAEIAERKLTGEELLKAVDSLKLAKDAGERASRAKDDFLAALSHELRTPLTPALMTVTALREDVRLPPGVREILEMVERNIALEARLIDDLLDLTKISHGKLQLRWEPCDAHHLIGFAMEIVREDARAKGVSIECSLEAKHSGLTADPTRLQQVFWNLLRNAVKFTPKDGRISITTREERTAESGTRLRIEVTDTGIGIAAARIEEIFLPFDQGGLMGDHRFGGVGLGLAIARSVLDLHGGRIKAQSEGPNCGSTFIVELPGATEPPPAPVSRPAPVDPGEFVPMLLRPSSDSWSLRLLVVEDHPNTLQTLARLLKLDGHQVVTASTVALALAEAAAGTFDLVISDIGLPDGTGIELMEKLSAQYGLRGIALSGYGMEEDLARSRAAGFVAHLIKPVAMAELRRVIASLPPKAR